MKRILFIITQSEFGGAQRFLSSLIPQLPKKEFEALVATGSTGDEHFTEHLRNLDIANTTLKHLVRDLSLLSDFRAISEIRKLINSWKPDTLFLLSSKAGFLGSLATRYKLHVTRPKVIYRIGGWAFNDPQSALRRKIIIQAEKFSAKYKDIIILNNAHDFDQAKELKIVPKQQTLMIHNGIDTYHMKLLPRDQARQKLGINENEFVVGTIAHDYPSKGLKYLPKNGNYRSIVLSGVKHASRYLNAFDVYVSPSVKEGFSWAVLEAMAAKVPVIATRVGAAPEMIENGVNGFLVEPRRPEQIAGCIRQLMDSDHTRQEFSIRGHQKVLQEFDLMKMVREIKELL